MNMAVKVVLLAAVLSWPTLAVARDASRLVATNEAISTHSDAPADAALLVPTSPVSQPPRADFLGEVASMDARRVADWAVASRDNDGLPYIIIDKTRARVFVFDSNGRLRGATFALLGKARGDDSVPGIGNQKLMTIRPEERTTPAGRFVASLGHDLEQDILWIDYGNAISLQRVIKGAPGDHRLQRLATTSPLDKRISYGCINVPVKFFDEVVLETFTGTSGIVYILPEIKTIQDVFSLSGVPAPASPTARARVAEPAGVAARAAPGPAD
jgi:hypothetical protein